MTGESADASARRMREKAKRLNRAAESYERGAEGERQTAAALAVLPVEEWTVLHDLAWPGRRYANVDHVVVGPSGVFVIDSKNWSGRISADRGVLKQNGRRRESAVTSTEEAAQAVRQLLGPGRDVPVHGVLCFVRDEEVVGRIEKTILCSTANIVTMLQTREPMMPSAIQDEVARHLSAELIGAGAPGRGRLTLADRWVLSRPEARPTSSRRPRRRTPAKSSLAGSVVAMSLVIGVLGLAVSQPQVLEWFGETVAGLLIDNHEPEQPADTPDDERRQQPRTK